MNKLKNLQNFIKEKNISALLIPHTDEFQAEYIAPYAQRLAWVTGFTGTAGFAIITRDKAAFFTDGRYLLQAKEQVPDDYEHYNIGKTSPSQWIRENLSAQDTIGYDPWLFTEVQLSKYDRPLIPLSSNPIDDLWTDQPPPSQNPIRLHSLKYAGETDESKRSRIAASLKADQVLLTASDSIAWLLNIRGNDVAHMPIVHSFCLLRQDGTYDLFVDPQKITPEVRTTLEKNGGHLIDISQILPHLAKKDGSCQIDPLITPMIFLHTLEKAGIPIIREQDPCLLPKSLKNATELEGAQEAHRQDGLALCRFFEWLKGQPLQGETTELSASQKLHEFRKKGEDFQDLSFDTISAFKEHGAIIHYRVTQKSSLPLKGDGLYLVDSGGQYLTGTTDVTRTIALGTPSPEEKDRYTRVLKGSIALEQAIFPKGTTGAQLDVLARQFLWQIGCDYEHGTGHGVGSYLSVHEGPQGISKRCCDVPLEPGMILSNEPGYYKEGSYGIRIENLMKVVEIPHLTGFFGFETLTLAPLDEKLIEYSLLTSQERKWVETYHERIRRKIQ